MRWKKRVFKRADVELAKLKSKLNLLQNRPNLNLEEIRETQERITKLWRQEASYWEQRSRLKWLSDGDRNTKFFHATTLQRRDRNRILRIKDDQGSWVEGREEIFNAVMGHFDEVYTASPIRDMSRCLQKVPRLVTDDIN